MGRRKGFDKKSSVKFKLVHRSQRDPLAADESAPQMVFVDINEDNERKEEQKKYGIYFDDNYDYLQHIRDVDPLTEWQPVEEREKSKKSDLQLPSSLFPSAVEEKEGLLNKAVLPVGPQPDWDPEVVAAMDEDFDFDDPNNQIDDDFVLQAEEEVGEESHHKSGANDDDDDDWEDVSDSEESTLCGSDESGDDSGGQFSDEETKSHFTNYSMSSSVMRRNQNLTLLDQRFETLFETEYADECEIGALDFDDIEGTIDPNNSELMADLVDEFQRMKNEKQVYEKMDSKEFHDFYRKRRNDAKESEELTEIEIFENRKNRDNDGFDCESIISTYSNLYNRPKIITERSIKYPQRVRINEKTGLPVGVLEKPGLTAKKLAKLDAMNAADTDSVNKSSKSVRSSASRLSELSVRPSDETPEQRRQRKSELKEYRRERRLEKKANKEAFKTEDIRLNKEVMNLKKSLNAVKLV
ncbi:unnamed protein product [Oppiella nova]|uniref:Protein LTV1 homolog n=1 Tax=Oppiella nova TaxID=334625 RepID=A0A7R9M8E3_9ACAR|nr:unnamed protein product [Oppiella nova]CAG2172558.1 unnamed protein product [Oppiella nova]